MDFAERQLSSQRIYDGAILSLRRDVVSLPDGGTAYREVIDHGGAVCVIPLFDDGQVGMVRQYRYSIESMLLEIPAGKMDEGETHLECAKRELSEETGLVAEKYDYLGCVFPAAAYDTELVHIYLARGLTQGEAHLDEGEFLSYETIPLTILEEMVMNNEIPDAKTVIAVLKTRRILEQEAAGR